MASCQFYFQIPMTSGAVLLMVCSGGLVVAVQSGQIQTVIRAVTHPSQQLKKSLSGWDDKLAGK